MEGPFTVTGKTLATMIRNAPQLSPSEIEDNSDALSRLPGLPAGVKFDPSDLQLLQHLEGKVGLGNSKAHILIDEFIPTLKEVEGICYTHPENLPGIKMDGSSSHFFHKVTNAYYFGNRKRRKISNRDNTCDDHMTWHKTGKSTPILDNGVMKGWRKILVLYSKKGCSKVNKANWTMHQYHLGVDEDEKDGQLVVSKVFWQLPSNKTGKSKMSGVNIEPDSVSVEIDPTTPNTYPPPPCRPNSGPCKTEQNQEEEEIGLPAVQLKAQAEELERCAVTSQPVDDAALPGEHHENTVPALHEFSYLDDMWEAPQDYFSTFVDMEVGSLDSVIWHERLQHREEEAFWSSGELQKD